jgi:hypothetical protein
MTRHGKQLKPLLTRPAAAFQELVDEAFADLLKKHKQPVGLMASLKESLGARKRRRAKK